MKSWLRTEDGLAVILGMTLVALGALALVGVDALGWVVKLDSKGWIKLDQALAPASKAYGGLPGVVSLLLTFLFLLALLTTGAWLLGANCRRFILGFTAVFGISYLCWLTGHNAYLAATPEKRSSFGIAWSLGLTGEAGFILALMTGLVIGNFFPRAAAWLKESARPEWYIKTAIVILGASYGVKAAAEATLFQAIMFRGLAAIVEAYLIYWALVYFVARRFFGFSREMAAPLASGISICGVSAAITTGAAIRARPVVPIMVSSLVVIFSVFELLILPFAARAWLSHEPMVAAAWMGLAVKTDGAAFSSGAITESLIYARAVEGGVAYKEGYMMATTTTIKVMIDLFIGVWALVLAVVWSYGIDRKPDRGVPLREIWQRFPKFVFGYFLAFLGSAGPFGLAWPARSGALEAGMREVDLFRGFFFVMTFFAIGLASDFKRLWAEGIARLALVYVVCLFGFVIWIGLAISWLFFHGVMPPVAAPGGS